MRDKGESKIDQTKRRRRINTQENSKNPEQHLSGHLGMGTADGGRRSYGGRWRGGQLQPLMESINTYSNVRVPLGLCGNGAYHLQTPWFGPGVFWPGGMCHRGRVSGPPGHHCEKELYVSKSFLSQRTREGEGNMEGRRRGGRLLAPTHHSFLSTGRGKLSQLRRVSMCVYVCSCGVCSAHASSSRHDLLMRGYWVLPV